VPHDGIKNRYSSPVSPDRIRAYLGRSQLHQTISNTEVEGFCSENIYFVNLIGFFGCI
jgi:hypothetical protein